MNTFSTCRKALFYRLVHHQDFNLTDFMTSIFIIKTSTWLISWLQSSSSRLQPDWFHDFNLHHQDFNLTDFMTLIFIIKTSASHLVFINSDAWRVSQKSGFPIVILNAIKIIIFSVYTEDIYGQQVGSLYFYSATAHFVYPQTDWQSKTLWLTTEFMLRANIDETRRSFNR